MIANMVNNIILKSLALAAFFSRVETMILSIF